MIELTGGRDDSERGVWRGGRARARAGNNGRASQRAGGRATAASGDGRAGGRADSGGRRAGGGPAEEDGKMTWYI